MLSELLSHNYKTNKAPNIHTLLTCPLHFVYLSICFVNVSIRVLSFHFHFAPDIDSYDFGDGILCLFPVNHSIIYSAILQPWQGVISKHGKKKTLLEFCISYWTIIDVLQGM